MTPRDCVDVVEFLAARCPAMRMHENTPDSWYVDLAEHSRDDALEAVRRLSRRQPFVSLAELLGELDGITRQRAGRERLNRLEQRILEENPPGELRDAAVAALHVGQDAPRVSLRAEVMRRADARRRSVEEDVAARREHAERRAQAERELEAVRAKVLATSTDSTTAEHADA